MESTITPQFIATIVIFIVGMVTSYFLQQRKLEEKIERVIDRKFKDMGILYSKTYANKERAISTERDVEQLQVQVVKLEAGFDGIQIILADNTKMLIQIDKKMDNLKT